MKPYKLPWIRNLRNPRKFDFKITRLLVAAYIIVIRMHQGVYEFYKPKGLRL